MHACGFDSIPSDIGVFLLHEAANADTAGELEDTTYAIHAMNGRPSGGKHARTALANAVAAAGDQDHLPRER